jgi:hypothetical protein
MKHHNAKEKDEIGEEGGRGIWKEGGFRRDGRKRNLK